MKPNSERQEELPPGCPPRTGIRETLYSVTLTGWFLTGLFNAMDIYRPPAFTALWLLPFTRDRQLKRVPWLTEGEFRRIVRLDVKRERVAVERLLGMEMVAKTG